MWGKKYPQDPHSAGPTTYCTPAFKLHTTCALFCMCFDLNQRKNCKKAYHQVFIRPIWSPPLVFGLSDHVMYGMIKPDPTKLFYWFLAALVLGLTASFPKQHRSPFHSNTVQHHLTATMPAVDVGVHNPATNGETRTMDAAMPLPEVAEPGC